jgi:hypothetical protein
MEYIPKTIFSYLDRLKIHKSTKIYRLSFSQPQYFLVYTMHIIKYKAILAKLQNSCFSLLYAIFYRMVSEKPNK